MMQKCVLCNEIKYKKLFDVGGKTILRCENCGLVVTSHFKNPDYHKYHREADYKKFEKHYKNIFKKRFNLINKFKNGAERVLDIGASTGTMLDLFSENRWETWGVEPSGNYRVARDKGHKVINNKFEKANLPNNYFDLVILNHTLEHMDDPILVLMKVKKILRKGGIVLIDVPNFGSLSAKILKANWPYILPNEHKYHFTTPVMKKILKKVGIEVTYWESRSGVFDYASPISEIWLSLITLKKRFFKNILGLPGAAITTCLNIGTSFSMVGMK